MPTHRKPPRSPESSTVRRSNPKLSSTERQILRLIAEQGAIPLDQLIRLAGAKPRKVESAVARLERFGCLFSTTFHLDEPAWFMPTALGDRCLGIECRRSRPAASSLNHCRGIIEARIELEAQHPRGQWVSERALLRKEGRNGQLPDGLYEIDGERWAIEVELTRKSRPRVRRRAVGLMMRFHKVMYFCSDSVLSCVTAVQSEFDVGRFEIRAAAGATRAPRVQKGGAPSDHPVSDSERRLLALISEEGVVAVDQLAALMGADVRKLQRQLKLLEKHHLVVYGFPKLAPNGWVWCTDRGAVASGAGLPRLFVTSPARLPRRRALMAVRLAVTGHGGGGGWTSRRELRRKGQSTSLEMAVWKDGKRRIAIVVLVDPLPRSPKRVRTWMPRLIEEYDLVWWYCSSSSEESARRLVSRDAWKGVEIRRLPEDQGLAVMESSVSNQPKPSRYSPRLSEHEEGG